MADLSICQTLSAKFIKCANKANSPNFFPAKLSCYSIAIKIVYDSLLCILYSCVATCNVTCSCTLIPSNSSCTNYETYFQYTEDIDLLQLEFKAMNYIDENVTNEYCRNYLREALFVTIYPPCNVSNNDSVQQLCPGICESLLNNSTCSSDTTNVVEFVSSQMTTNFTINCSNSFTFANTFLNTSICYSNNRISILDNAKVPST